MPSLDEMHARRCVADLIRVMEQVPVRAAVRSPVRLDDGWVAMIALWTILRWERTFLLVLLEDLGVDMWALTRELDALLEERKAMEAAIEGSPGRCDWRNPLFQRRLDRFLVPLLDRAGWQASAMRQPYVGTEHLLLAIVAGADGAFSSLLARHGITCEKVKEALLAMLPGEIPTADVWEAPPPATSRLAWMASWDHEAVGMPRRFGLSILLLIVTLYALLFAGMEMLGAPPAVFAVVAVMVTAVGFGQMFLFEGKYPRAASIWVGACLFPIEVFFVLVARASDDGLSVDFLAMAFVALLFSIPFGAFFGYLSGGVTAGVFLILGWYAKRKEEEGEEGEGEEGEAEGDPLGADR